MALLAKHVRESTFITCILSSDPAVLGIASMAKRTTGGMEKEGATGRVSAQAEEFR